MTYSKQEVSPEDTIIFQAIVLRAPVSAIEKIRRERCTRLFVLSARKNEVPFKPDGSRQVYCRECYSKRRQKPANTIPAGAGYGLSRSDVGTWKHPPKRDKSSLMET